MHPILNEHLRGKVSSQLISGMTTSNLGNNIEIGTPCLIDLGHIAAQGSGLRQIADELQKKMDANDIDAVNDIMSTTGWSLRAMVALPQRYQCGYVMNVMGHQVHCFPHVPIIYDKGKIIEAESLKSAMNSRIIKGLPEKILDNLQKERYITYIISKLCKSKYKDFRDTVTTFFKHMMKAFPSNTCIDYKGNSSYTLIDTVVISFYRLADIIPVFDSKSVNGFAMEIMLMSSTLTKNDIGNEGYMSSVMWLFSKDEDNIFTIDGENIRRQNQVGTMDALSPLIFDTLGQHMPNDEVPKKKSAKSRNGGK